MIGPNKTAEETILKDLAKLNKIKEYIKKRRTSHSFKQEQSWKKINMMMTYHTQLILEKVGDGEKKDIYETIRKRRY